MTEHETSWDGLSIAPDWPNGATIVVRRTDGDMLLLHRAHHGPDFDGDWAWTPPAGCRRPGEPILAGALREMAEEAGLDGIEITPIDLSVRWALFTAEVSQDTAVTLVDVEHDQFQWVRPAEAIAMCKPNAVSSCVRRVSMMPAPTVGFRSLTRADLPSLLTWLNTPHVARWWTDRPADIDGADIDSAEAKYGPRIDGVLIDGVEPTRVDVILADGRPIGFIQSTPLAADPDYLATAAAATDGGADAVTLDYAIGEPDLIGQGIGARVIWAYMRDVVFSRAPQTRFVVVTPTSTNAASVRACEKAGFQRIGDFFPPEPDAVRHALCVLDRGRVFGL